MSKSTIVFCPVRLLVYLPIFSGIQYRNRVRRYAIMRDFYNKKSHQLLTFVEIAEYIGKSPEELIGYLPEFERI